MQRICSLQNIDKSYEKKQVLNQFNLDIYQGEMVAIVGKSGVGKTTVLNILGLLEKPDSGCVTLFEQDMSKIKLSQVNQLLRYKISYLFQNYALIENETISKNLDVALAYVNKSKREKQKMKEEALKKVGLDVDVNDKIYTLSGGQQQRVAIARLLLKPCDLILADEPTGSLDAETRDDILGLLTALNKEGKTIVIVTHDATISMRCHKTINL